MLYFDLIWKPFFHSNLNAQSNEESSSGTRSQSKRQSTAPLTASLSLFPLDNREVEKATWSLPVLCCSRTALGGHREEGLKRDSWTGLKQQFKRQYLDTY